MAKTNLVIIESPYKVPTIKNYLGSNYKVVASMGHLRDLPKSRLAVDVENDFEAEYINIRGKGDKIKELKNEAKKADKIFFATDPDREGESISWHLANVLGIKTEDVKRVCFNELTKNAIKTAIKDPKQLDMNLVNSQQARRILDRIVGYKLSPLLWKNVHSGLSAGRVQSVATRIIVDRENEIQAFVPEEYWTVEATVESKDGNEFRTRFVKDKNGNSKIKNQKEADYIVSCVNGKEFNVVSVDKSERVKNPQPPFTTSTLQQEASRKLGFRSKKIMEIAQSLYEGVNLGKENGGTQGLITYMRTDSLRVSDEAADKAAEFIKKKYGESSLPDKKRVYKSKGKVQDAHEAIRPANFDFEPASIRKYLSDDQYKLYKLIFNRFMASQMASAVYDTVTVDLDVSGVTFRATGSVLREQGYLVEYGMNDEDEGSRLPEINENESLKCVGTHPEQHFTEPPPRFNDGSLIKFLEEKEIGRPSTFAAIINTITDRNYVVRDGKNLKPTELGKITNDIMMKHFNDIVDYEFTKQLEDELDGVAGGEQDMKDVLKKFYGDFENELSNAEKALGTDKITSPVELTNIKCDKCGATMVVRQGRFGRFAACPNYPKCKNTITIDENGNPVVKKAPELKIVEGEKCPTCGGNLVTRRGRYGEFFACANYPTCSYTKEIVHPVGVSCPLCGGDVISRIATKSGKQYFGCSNYPKCKFMSWNKPTAEKCPECGEYLVEKKNGDIACSSKDCKYYVKKS